MKRQTCHGMQSTLASPIPKSNCHNLKAHSSLEGICIRPVQQTDEDLVTAGDDDYEAKRKVSGQSPITSAIAAPIKQGNVASMTNVTFQQRTKAITKAVVINAKF